MHASIEASLHEWINESSFKIVSNFNDTSSDFCKISGILKICFAKISTFSEIMEKQSPRNFGKCVFKSGPLCNVPSGKHLPGLGVAHSPELHDAVVRDGSDEGLRGVEARPIDPAVVPLHHVLHLRISANPKNSIITN